MFGQISTGALSDLEKVTKQAYAMVTMYGLNDRIGNMSYYDSSGQSEYTFGKPYSERTAQTIDEEVSKIIEGQYERAKRILAENRDKLTALASQLLEKEVIFKEDLEKIFGRRPFDRFDPEQALPAAPATAVNGNGNGTPVPDPSTTSSTADPTPDAPAPEHAPAG